MEQLRRDGLVFDVADTGPADGDVVVLLHGWPQDRTAWDAVTPLLVGAGLRVLAPDQRGYSPRARPGPVAAYRMSQLVADVLALVDASGAPRVHLVGHDWGGAVAWAFAERHPERLHSLTVVSTPHHRAMEWALRHGGEQARKSWYMLAFQLPLLPELVLRRRLPDVLRRSGLPEEHVHRYAARFREPGAARGGLAWYRALRPRVRDVRDRGRRHRRDSSPLLVTVPTTYLWGRRDPALGRAAAERSEQWVAADYRFVEVDGGHWLPETQPAAVADVVLDRVRSTPQG